MSAPDSRPFRTFPVYAPDTQDAARRYLLGTEGLRPLVILGLNPSVADKEKADRTITRISEYAKRNHSDSFIMLNLYAQRTPYPKDLHAIIDAELHRQNLYEIDHVLDKFNKIDMLAAWGETINIRPYLKQCLRDILSLTPPRNVRWLQISETLTKSGHPRHPSRGSYKLLHPFDIYGYLRSNFTL